MTRANETIALQLEHRTIREFTNEPVPKETMDTLLQIAQRTATSNGMQSYSIIRVTDPQLKEAIARVGNQAYIAREPELLIFIVDSYRNGRIALEKGYKGEAHRDMDRFFQGWTDACLAAQNVVLAAESLGLGANYLGCILNDTAKMIELLKLPELTFPVVGVGLGYPNQTPQLKPRMDMSLRVFENSYSMIDDYLTAISEYDKEMQTYYDLRNANKRVDSFSDQVVSKLVNVIPGRQDILNVIKSQGFDLMIK
ncbi:MAG TPA: NADPH-dependent oxidoreductase [Gudongella oleilytica]|jgi:nitroreductase|nr:NADPH-dependent oxidoreductase [Gudongella oleilytica]